MGIGFRRAWGFVGRDGVWDRELRCGWVRGRRGCGWAWRGNRLFGGPGSIWRHTSPVITGW